MATIAKIVQGVAVTSQRIARDKQRVATISSRDDYNQPSPWELDNLREDLEGTEQYLAMVERENERSATERSNYIARCESRIARAEAQIVLLKRQAYDLFRAHGGFNEEEFSRLVWPVLMMSSKSHMTSSLRTCLLVDGILIATLLAYFVALTP